MVDEAADDLALILNAAQAAGDMALALRNTGLTTEMKADRTPISNADLALDALLKDQLTRARPDYGWLSEETTDDPDRLGRERVFVVDPIDGTRAFVRHKPWWSVCVAVVKAGAPWVAVVCAPDRAETYHAIEGQGARLNGAAIACNDRDEIEGCALLSDAQMLRHPAWPRAWPPMRIEARNSIAYRLCSVASGEFDATLALSPKSEWDLAAGGLIAAEAGCVVTDHRGDRLSYNRAVPTVRSLVCAGPALHELILDRVRPIALSD